MARQLVALALLFVALVAGLTQAADSPAAAPVAGVPAADSISITPSSSQSPDASSPLAADDDEFSSPPAPASEASAPGPAPVKSSISAAPQASAPNAAEGPKVSSAASDDYY